MSKCKTYIIAAAVIVAILLIIIAAKVFAADYYTLTGNSCGTGLTGNTCVGGLITETYPAGTVVTLTPSPKTGYLFIGWRGDCTGKGSCVLTMTRNMTVMADFKLKPGKVRNLRIAQLRRNTDVAD